MRKTAEQKYVRWISLRFSSFLLSPFEFSKVFASQNLIPRWALLDFGSYGLTNADCDDASYPIVHLCCGNGYANAQPTLSACSLATFPSTQCIMVVTGWYGCIEITNLFSETGYICHGSETVEQYSTSKIVRCECSISNFALDATIVVSTAPTLTPTMAPTATPTLSLAPTVEPTFSPATIPPTVAPSLSLALNSSPPSSMPSSAPSFAIRWEQGSVSDKRRSRKGGLCDNMCSSHGICEININCNCFVGLDNEPLWTGPDCSLRACPKGFAWVGSVVSANNMKSNVQIKEFAIIERVFAIAFLAMMLSLVKEVLVLKIAMDVENAGLKNY
eukprot:gene10825-11798_t